MNVYKEGSIFSLRWMWVFSFKGSFNLCLTTLTYKKTLSTKMVRLIYYFRCMRTFNCHI